MNRAGIVAAALLTCGVAQAALASEWSMEKKPGITSGFRSCTLSAGGIDFAVMKKTGDPDIHYWIEVAAFPSYRFKLQIGETVHETESNRFVGQAAFKVIIDMYIALKRDGEIAYEWAVTDDQIREGVIDLSGFEALLGECEAWVKRR